MNKQLTLELSNELGLCCGGLAKILEPHYNLNPSGLDNAILENYGFLLAELLFQGGLDMNEACSCIACFIGVNVGSDTHKFLEVVKSMQFYVNLLQSINKKQEEVFLYTSIIIYNLLNPFLRDDFNNGIPLQKMDGLIYYDLYVKIKCFLQEDFPQCINPILLRIETEN